jgi:hypothetical protein
MAVTRFTVQDNGTLAWSTIDPDAGDLVLVFFANDGGDNQSAPTSPEPLTRIDSGDGSADVSGGVYVRVCDGTETGNLVSTTVAGAASGFNVNTEEYGCHVLHVPAAEWSGDVDEVICSTKQEATSGTINPPQVTPSWDGTAEEWTAVVFATRDDDDGISALTANYAANFARTASGSNGPEIASSWRTVQAASENPGNATQTGTAEAVVSVTVAIRGAAGGQEFEAAATVSGAGSVAMVAETEAETDAQLTGAGSITAAAEAEAETEIAAAGVGAATVSAEFEPPTYEAQVEASGGGVASIQAETEADASAAVEGTGSAVGQATTEAVGAGAVAGAGDVSANAGSEAAAGVKAGGSAVAEVVAETESEAAAQVEGAGEITAEALQEGQYAAVVQAAGAGQATITAETEATAAATVDGAGTVTGAATQEEEPSDPDPVGGSARVLHIAGQLSKAYVHGRNTETNVRGAL